MEEQTTPFSIVEAAAESNPELNETSTEQQEESSETQEATTDTSNDETTEVITDETSVTDESTEEEEESTEDNDGTSTDSDIVDLSVDNNQESTEEVDNETEESTSTNFGEILNGEFDDEEELSNYLIEQNQKIEELESNQGTTGFANEYVEKLNAHVLAGGSAEQFTRVQGVNVDNMSAVDILTTGIMWDNPDFSKEDATTLLKSKFRDSVDDDDNLDASNPVLREAANKAAKNIRDIQAEDTIVPQNGVTEEEWSEQHTASQNEERETREIETTERMEDWMQPGEDALNNLMKNGLVVPLTEEKGFRYAFEGDEKYQNELLGRVDKTLMSMGTSVKENPGAAKGIMEMLYKTDNFDDIMKKASINGANSANKEWFKKAHNPSAIGKGDNSTSESNALPTAEEAMSKVFGL
jgi:hypothetical protein